MGELGEAITARVTSTSIVRWGHELKLFAQWKRGELRTRDLVVRLEELDRKAKSPESSPSE